MAHPSEGLLQAFIDGEVAADERARVAAHLEQCAECRAELHELRVAAAAFSAALAHADLAPDLERARAAVAARAMRRSAASAAPERVRLIPREPARVAAVRRAFLRAAVLVLLVAGAASAAVPGSPVRRFFVNLWHQTSRLFAPRTASRTLPPRVRISSQPAPAPALPAGVSVMARDGGVHILLHEPAPGLRVLVRMVPGARASVEASGAAASATFRTGPGRIEVNGAGAGDLRITIPRLADRALVEVDGRPLFLKDHDLVRHAVPVDSGAGGTLFQIQP
jgi:hypothetical protein